MQRKEKINKKKWKMENKYFVIMLKNLCCFNEHKKKKFALNNEILRGSKLMRFLVKSIFNNSLL